MPIDLHPNLPPSHENVARAQQKKGPSMSLNSKLAIALMIVAFGILHLIGAALMRLPAVAQQYDESVLSLYGD